MDEMSLSTGLPLLSGPPPPSGGRDAEMSCRKCAKEFNILFTRSRRCSHCGYAYCHSCTDYQALMPRQSQTNESSEPGFAFSSTRPGYVQVNVCAFCIEFLQITAASRPTIKTLQLARLRKYAAAYNIRIEHAVEKDDIIDTLLNARLPNGCLPSASESYYRKYSVPNRSLGSSSSVRSTARDIFNSVRNNLSGNSSNSSASSAASPTSPLPPPTPQHSRPEFARPDLEPGGHAGTDARNGRGPAVRPRLQPYSSGQSGTPPPRNNATRPQSAPRPVPSSAPSSGQNRQYRPHPPGAPRFPQYPQYPQSGYPQYTSRARATSVPPGPPPVPRNARPTANPTPPRAASTAPPPTLDELLEMSLESISSMSIGTLKTILYHNHVNAGQILEKSDLVRKIEALVEDEKRERERMRLAEEREDEERIRRQREMMVEFERQRMGRERERRAREEEDRRSEEIASGQSDDRMDVDGEENQSREGSEALASTTQLEGTPESESASAAPSDTTTASSVPPPPPPVETKPALVPAPKKAPTTSAFVERTGLCVVCQDEEANIAIVDCGHMALCRTCCDAIMSPAGTRECPLCRTRIVTEARLLRIFKA